MKIFDKSRSYGTYTIIVNFLNTKIFYEQTGVKGDDINPSLIRIRNFEVNATHPKEDGSLLHFPPHRVRNVEIMKEEG